jgi:type I restriction enzyme S subunit
MREGWKIKKFEDCLQKVKSTKKIPKKSFLDEGRYPIISQENEFINGYWNNYNDVLKVEKPIVIFGDHTKKIKYIDFDFVKGADGIVTLLPVNEINSKFFVYQIQNFELRDLGYARHYRILKEKNIVVPPLLEQKQIVAILDEAFTAIDQAKANIEKNIEYAKELFQSKLNATFEEFNEKFNSKKLGSILEILTDYHANGSYKVLKENVELKDQEDYAWMVRSTDFEKDFKKDFKYIDEHAYNHLKKSKIFGGEIIISKIGNAGKVYVMPEIDRPCSLAMNLFLLRLNKEKMISKYLYYYLQSTKGEKQILSKLNGATTKTITKDNVRDLNIPEGEVVIQNQKVLEFEKLSQKVIELENFYNQKIIDIEELKKSILQKAFAGELTGKELAVEVE